MPQAKARPTADDDDPLEAGVRVSLELPEAGTCVAVVDSRDHGSLVLDLLDEIPDGELEARSTFDLFLPRPQGIYHWLCSLSASARPTERKSSC